MLKEKLMLKNQPDILQEVFQPQELEQVEPLLYKVVSEYENRPRGQKLAVVLTGPTGSGKDTIRDLLPSDKYLSFKTVTTRLRRPSEPGGEADPYHRLSETEFLQGMDRGEFFETNKFADSWYGGRFSDIEEALNSPLIPVLRPDPQGAANYLELAKAGEPPFDNVELLVVFILPPQRDLIAARLYNRDVAPFLESSDLPEREEKFKKRLHLAQNEIVRAREAHYVLINDEGRHVEAAKTLARQLSQPRN